MARDSLDEKLKAAKATIDAARASTQQREYEEAAVRKCKNCKFYGPKNSISGECLFNPKIPIMDGAVMRWVRPPMMPDEHCGHWKAPLLYHEKKD